MRWTGSPKGENAGCSRVNGADAEASEIDKAKRRAQPEGAGAIESIILSRGLDAIRDSRIACKDGFRDTP